MSQWPLLNNGELTTELLESVQCHKEFDVITEQARAQLELNADQETCIFKAQEVCCKCTNQVTLHSEGNELPTDQCSGCRAGSDLWRQLVVYVMYREGSQPVEEPIWREASRTHSGMTTRDQQSNSYWLNDSWQNGMDNDYRQHTEHSGASSASYLCCSITFEQGQCSNYPLHNTMYCASYWH